MLYYRKANGDVFCMQNPPLDISGITEITELEFHSKMDEVISRHDTEPEPTPEERLNSIEQRTDALESNSAEIQEALDMLLSGVTE